MLIWFILILFLAAFIMLPNDKFFYTKYVWLLALIPFFLFCYFLSFIPQTMNGIVTYHDIEWFPSIGVSLSLYVDGLSILFTLLITGIGTLIIIYSIAYLKDEANLSRYFCYLFLFMASMLGIVLFDNLITLFVCWEITSISSYLLIGFYHDKTAARRAALNALLITSSGALCLLVGFVLLGIATGTYSTIEILRQGPDFIENAYYPMILFLILIGAFTKSAQFPFHFWLPNAMEAPTPVSAYLHSATMVQVGIYLLARFHPIMSASSYWFISLTVFGAITMMVGVLLAFKQYDMKLILAYTTVTALGSLVFLLGSDQVLVIKAAVAFLISHALYKATLFMVVGDIQHQTGTRHINEVRGLRRAMPITFLAALVAGASMAGLPPLLGFYVKELVYEANLAAPIAAYVLTGMVVLANMMMAALAFLLVFKPFLGIQKPQSVLEANKKMSLNAFLLASITLFISIAPFTINQAVLSPAASSILGYPVKMELTLWHGFTPSLALSLITLLGATILYLKNVEIKQSLSHLNIFYKYGPTYAWQNLIYGILKFADWQTQIIQCGKQRVYLTVVFITITLCLTSTMISQNAINISALSPTLTWMGIFLCTWILSSALMTCWVDTYIKGLIFLGMFGLGTTLLFITNSAPDVAMTQVLVETLIVIIVVLNIYRQPPLPKIISDANDIKILNLLIAISLGMTITFLLLIITHGKFNSDISNYFLNNSVALGRGRNVVNVILVDFRALDTLGEVLVVATASLGVFGLLRRRKKRRKI